MCDECEAKKQAERITTTQSMHIDGGEEYSVTGHNVWVDNKKTHITRIVRTDGSPEHKRVEDFLRLKDEEFDMLTETFADAVKWVMERKDL